MYVDLAKHVRIKKFGLCYSVYIGNKFGHVQLGKLDCNLLFQKSMQTVCTKLTHQGWYINALHCTAWKQKNWMGNVNVTIGIQEFSLEFGVCVSTRIAHRHYSIV